MAKVLITTDRLKTSYGLVKGEKYEIVSKSSDGHFIYVMNLKHTPSRSDLSAVWVTLDKDDCKEVKVTHEAIVN